MRQFEMRASGIRGLMIFAAWFLLCCLPGCTWKDDSVGGRVDRMHTDEWVEDEEERAWPQPPCGGALEDTTAAYPPLIIVPTAEPDTLGAPGDSSTAEPR